MAEVRVIPQSPAYTQIKTTGGEKRLDYTFPVLIDGYIKVEDVDENGVIFTLTEGVDYDLFGVGDETGGYVDLKGSRYPNGAEAGHTFNLLQNVPEKRSTDFQQAGDFFARSLNQELDLQIQIDQQLRRDINRAIIVPLGTEADLNLPAPSAGKALVWNQEANALTNSTINVDSVISEVTSLTEQAKQSATAAANSESSASASALSASNSASEASATLTQAEAVISSAKNTALQEFNNNSTQKTEAFNTNAAGKQAAVDASAVAAAESESHSQTWAEGTDEAVAGIGGEHSAKGWAEEAKKSAVLPDQTGQAGKYLATDGTTASWKATYAVVGSVPDVSTAENGIIYFIPEV